MAEAFGFAARFGTRPRNDCLRRNLAVGGGRDAGPESHPVKPFEARRDHRPPSTPSQRLKLGPNRTYGAPRQLVPSP
jgi:hypothetical protein